MGGTRIGLESAIVSQLLGQPLHRRRVAARDDDARWARWIRVGKVTVKVRGFGPTKYSLNQIRRPAIRPHAR
jgi:hypothetical protein